MKKLIFLFILISIANSEKSIEKRDDSKIHFYTKDCGTRKNCYISPNDCDLNIEKCNFVLKWDFDGKLINYELTGVSSSWISVLFSDDKYIGKDNLVVCKRTENTISVNHYYKDTIESELEKLPINNDGLFNRYGEYDTGIIYCKFSRSKLSDSKLITNLNKAHYIYVGKGTQDQSIKDNLANSFQPSSDAVEFFTVSKPYEPSSWLVKTHASFMIIAWILFASIGIIIARYYKPMWPNHLMFRVRVWFAFHRPMMLSALILTIVGFIFILIEMNFTWSKHGQALTHSILGIIVIVLAILNPILGFIRPRPESRLRCLFFWFHWLIGTVAYCLAVPAIFIGMDLSKLDLPNWCAWLLFAWVIFHIIVEIILEIHYCCTFYKHTEALNEYDLQDKKVIMVKRNNPPGYRWKPTLLFIYSAFTATVVCAIIIAIILHDII